MDAKLPFEDFGVLRGKYGKHGVDKMETRVFPKPVPAHIAVPNVINALYSQQEFGEYVRNRWRRLIKKDESGIKASKAVLRESPRFGSLTKTHTREGKFIWKEDLPQIDEGCLMGKVTGWTNNVTKESQKHYVPNRMQMNDYIGTPSR